MLDDPYPSTRSTRARLLMVARAAGFVVIIALVAVGLSFAAHLLVQHSAWFRATLRQISTHGPTAPLVGLQEIVLLLIVTGVSLALIATEPRPVGTVSLLARLPRRTNLFDGRRAARHLGAGVLLGLCSMGLLMAGLVAAGAYHVTLTAGPVWIIVGNVLALAIAFGLVGFVEEFMFRGYLQRSLTDGIGFWPASLITSLLFALAHLGGVDTLAGSAGVMLYALFACAALRCTGSLWFIIGFHAAWDFAQSGIFGVHDSGWAFGGAMANAVASGPAWLTGGAAGPEASAPCFVLDMALLAAALYAGRVGIGAGRRVRTA